jgi:hypothetical protein
MRLIFAPQYPAKLRYQEWFLHELQEVFNKHFDEVITLGVDDSSATTKVDIKQKASPRDFSPLIESCRWESRQIEEYLSLKLHEDDILLIMDLSFPGFFPQVLYHKRPSKVFGFFHATSKNRYDYFNNETQYEKFQTEGALASVCDNVFVGSYYHKRKLLWQNIIVTYLPYPHLRPDPPETHAFRNLVSVARRSMQKVDSARETYLERRLGFMIERPNADSWDSYYRFLQQSKVMIITSKEETFGYQVVDAVLNGCVPIAPNSFSYPELLPQEYLYDPDENNFEDMFNLVSKALRGELPVPKLLCDWDMRSFYRNILEIMKG